MSIQISLSLFFATLTRKTAIRHIIFRGHTSLRGSYLLDTYSFAGQVAWKSLDYQFDLHSSEVRRDGTCGKAIIKEKQSRRLNKGYILCKVWSLYHLSDPCHGKKDVQPFPHLKRIAESDKRRLPGGNTGLKSRGTKDCTHEEREGSWHGHRRCGQTPCLHSRDTWLGWNHFHLFPRVCK